MVVEYKGSMYFVGTVYCMRCSRMERTDLFEDLDNKIIAKHPDAEEVVGVTPGDLSSLQIPAGRHAGPGRK